MMISYCLVMQKLLDLATLHSHGGKLDYDVCMDKKPGAGDIETWVSWWWGVQETKVLFSPRIFE